MTRVLGALIAISSVTGFAQGGPVRIEHHATSGAPVDAVAGSGVTLVFRVVNTAMIARTVLTRAELPEGWQALFVGDHLALPAQGSVIETVTVVPPRNAAAGTYTIRYEARLSPSDSPVAGEALVRIREHRQIAVSWLPGARYLPAGESGTFSLQVTNHGNVRETLTLDVRSTLGLSIETPWTRGTIDPGQTRRVVVVRPADRTRLGARETLTATAVADGLAAAAVANLGFDVVPEGRAPNPRRSTLPSVLTLRTGTGRSPGFGSFVGSGAVNARRTTTINFGFVARDRSHPFMFERDRNFAKITAPGVGFSAGDNTWSLSYLTESGHYGRGAGGRIDRRRWSAGAFIDMGRDDAIEGSQAGAFVGLGTGRVANLSAQYLARFEDGLRSHRLADIGSLRLLLRPVENLTVDLEAGVGQSAAGAGRAVSALLTFNSRRLTLFGRRVRKDDAYPLRDRTGLIDGAGVSLRPFGQLQLEATLDGTGLVDDPGLPIDAPTRQRITKARVAWGSLASVTAGRTEWTSPGRDWNAQWRRESLRADFHIPLGPAWLAPGAERGTEATPAYKDSPYSLIWLRAGVRFSSRNSIDVRMDYGRGVRGDANRIVRRASFGATLQPIDATRLTVRISNSASDALWLQGTQSITAKLDQRLPWRHHIVVSYQRRSGGDAFLRDNEAYRVDYVIPIGIPTRSTADAGSITVKVRDGESGRPLARMLVQIQRQSRMTDSNGEVAFTGLKTGNYQVTVSPDSLGPGRTVAPALPQVSIKSGSRASLSAVIVRTGKITGVLKKTPGAGIGNALIELVIDAEHRTAVTDAHGAFSFDDVPPGNWQVRVVRADIPAFYLLETSQITVTLTPAGTSHVVLRVVPKTQ